MLGTITPQPQPPAPLAVATVLAGLRARGWTRLDGPVHCPVWSRPALRIGDMLVLR
jgi:hypothetical protein